MHASLHTRDGGLVGRVEIPPFKLLPEVLTWGSRTFVLNAPEDATGVPRYVEACAFCVTGGLVAEKSPEPPAPVDKDAIASTSGSLADALEIEKAGPRAGQQKGYIVLTEEERRKGFVRPVRRSYRHVGRPGPRFPLRDLTEEELLRHDPDRKHGYVKYEEYPASESPLTGRYWTQEALDKVGKGCGVVTTMGQAIAETYARSPDFYGSTFCVGCGTHLPVGEDGEFVWEGTRERVGT